LGRSPPSCVAALVAISFLFGIRLPPRLPPFPYTTLFRSARIPRAPPSPAGLDARLADRHRHPSAAARPAVVAAVAGPVELAARRSEEHTSELQSRENLVCRRLLEKKKADAAAECGASAAA